MAKKKSVSEETVKSGVETPKPAARKKAATKAPAAPAGDPGIPAIDTSLAAQNAAKMLVSKATTGATPAQPAQESSLFKSMKQQIAKPKSASLSHLLGGNGPEKKSGTHFILNQRGHNQTSSAFNKTGVPRRTNG